MELMKMVTSFFFCNDRRRREWRPIPLTSRVSFALQIWTLTQNAASTVVSQYAVRKHSWRNWRYWLIRAWSKWWRSLLIGYEQTLTLSLCALRWGAGKLSFVPCSDWINKLFVSAEFSELVESTVCVAQPAPRRKQVTGVWSVTDDMTIILLASKWNKTIVRKPKIAQSNYVSVSSITPSVLLIRWECIGAPRWPVMWWNNCSSLLVCTCCPAVTHVSHFFSTCVLQIWVCTRRCRSW